MENNFILPEDLHERARYGIYRMGSDILQGEAIYLRRNAGTNELLFLYDWSQEPIVHAIGSFRYKLIHIPRSHSRSRSRSSSRSKSRSFSKSRRTTSKNRKITSKSSSTSNSSKNSSKKTKQ